MASRKLRAEYLRSVRLYCKEIGKGVGFWEFPPGSPKRLRGVELARQCGEGWDAIKDDVMGSVIAGAM